MLFDIAVEMGKVYVVFEGRIPGVYNTWMECEAQVSGYPGNVHKSFANRDEGEEALASYKAAKSNAFYNRDSWEARREDAQGRN